MRFGLPDGILRMRAPPGAPSTLPGGSLAQRLSAWQETLRLLPAWTHASWLAACGLPVPAAVSLSPSPSLAHAFATALGVGTPGAAAFETPGHALALLSPAMLCRVLRARALMRRRPALRRCLDPRLRQTMENWLHPLVFEAVIREAGDRDLHRDTDGMPLPPGLSTRPAADVLAWEGFCLFQQDGTWTDRHLLRLLRLGFPAGARVPLALHERPGARDGSAWVLQRLARFVPEAPWLPG